MKPRFSRHGKGKRPLLPAFARSTTSALVVLSRSLGSNKNMPSLRVDFSGVVFGHPMPITFRREALVLLMGDLFFLIVALWATLLIRYSALPSWDVFYTHLVPFSFLFSLSVLVFLIAGLYEKHTLLFKSQLSQTILYAQIANIMVGAFFFFLIPYFGIQPKTNLFIYLVLSTAFVSAWRIYLFPLLSRAASARALLFGSGAECAELSHEINGNSRYSINFVTPCLPLERAAGDQLLSAVKTHKASVVVMPFSHLNNSSASSAWDDLAVSGIRFVDSARLYEELFDRVLLSLLDHRWFLEESVRAETALYRFAKRITDIIVASVALVVLSPLFLLVAIAIKLGEGGKVFISQKRVGKGNKDIEILKFRTMLFDDGGDPEKQKVNRVTAVGAFLRKTQLDEIPQFWSVVRGDLSLIGPRPEIRSLAEQYETAIPFYSARLLMQPGISGWAQIKHKSPPKFSLDVEKTREKLSYDLYYLKHRSFAIDLSIVLRTVKILLSRAGL